MSKEQYIELIVEVLKKLNSERYFKILYFLVQKYEEEEH